MAVARRRSRSRSRSVTSKATRTSPTSPKTVPQEDLDFLRDFWSYLRFRLDAGPHKAAAATNLQFVSSFVQMLLREPDVLAKPGFGHLIEKMAQMAESGPRK
jgi:hypothetical protein